MVASRSVDTADRTFPSRYLYTEMDEKARRKLSYFKDNPNVSGMDSWEPAATVAAGSELRAAHSETNFFPREKKMGLVDNLFCKDGERRRVSSDSSCIRNSKV